MKICDISWKVYNNPANDYRRGGAGAERSRRGLGAVQTHSFQVLESERFKDLAEDLLSILAAGRRGRPIPFRPYLFYYFVASFWL